MVKSRLARTRRGITSLGCLFSILVVAAIVYFGVTIGEHYFRFYQYQDSIRQEVRFAAHNNDSQITKHLRERADSLGLPEAAGEVTIQRDGRHIEIESEYYEHIELPMFVREVRFNPHGEGIY